MNRIAVGVVALVVWLTAPLGCARPPAPPPVAAAPVGLVAGVKGTVEQWRQAYEVRSMEALAKLYAREPGLAIVEAGVLQLGWTAIEPILRARLDRARAFHVRISELEITALGDAAALAVGAMTRESSDGTTTVTETGVVMFALKTTATGWVIAGEHYSYRRPR